ncbi:hypothetical protein EYF80_066180 [Liparis tanakae]|uniref:Uncharacterized protein n=1 Tax=Liparis tanakae TaxID=230148 RepID=A0A4Z2E4L9_9TELE|nr:hypothetical protein EYF80_066180 [Liparis tanakae]
MCFVPPARAASDEGRLHHLDKQQDVSVPVHTCPPRRGTQLPVTSSCSSASSTSSFSPSALGPSRSPPGGSLPPTSTMMAMVLIG